MPDLRTVDLNDRPDPRVELRLESEDGKCVISVWLPAPMDQIGEVMRVFGELGFDVARQE